MHTKEFGYWEVFQFKLFPCCCSKSKRAVQFKQILKIVGERLDIGSMVTNCGNVNLLSNVLLEPYQMKIISHFKRGKKEQTKIARKLPITEAIQELLKNSKEKKGDTIHKKVDAFLLRMVEEDSANNSAVSSEES